MALNKKNAVSANEKNAAEAAAKEALTVNVEAAGTGLDSFRLEGVLINPARMAEQVTRTIEKDGQREKVTIKRHNPYGYRYVAKTDLEVPDFGRLTEKRQPMAQENYNGTRHVSAGEVFDLTLAENAAFLYREENASTARVDERFGEEDGKAVEARLIASNNTKGRAVASALPTTTLRISPALYANPEFFIPVATRDSEDQPWVVVPGLEKFAVLVARAAATRTHSPKAPKNQYAENLKNAARANFLASLSAKQAQ